MSSIVPGMSIVPDLGNSGGPARLISSGQYTGAGTHIWTNTHAFWFVMNTLDVVEQPAQANDNIEVAAGTPGANTLFFASSVGTGHTGGFHDQWQGFLLIGNGETVTITYAATSSSYWQVMAQGWWVNTYLFTSMSQTS